MTQGALCPLAMRALAVASCAQLLSEGGHKILAVNIKENEAIVSINYTTKTKALNGKPAGCTYFKGALYIVFQKDIDGVLVRWLEPYFDAQKTAKKVH